MVLGLLVLGLLVLGLGRLLRLILGSLRSLRSLGFLGNYCKSLSAGGAEFYSGGYRCTAIGAKTRLCHILKD